MVTQFASIKNFMEQTEADKERGVTSRDLKLFRLSIGIGLPQRKGRMALSALSQ